VTVCSGRGIALFSSVRAYKDRATSLIHISTTSSYISIDYHLVISLSFLYVVNEVLCCSDTVSSQLNTVSLLNRSHSFPDPGGNERRPFECHTCSDWLRVSSSSRSTWDERVYLTHIASGSSLVWFIARTAALRGYSS
jgi:hypothetical protein